MTTHPDFAYKLLTKADSSTLDALGHTATAVDIADGYVHLSTKDQLSETAMKYFAGEADCLLLEVHVSARSDVKWEASRGGALFPHIYGKLSKGDETRSWTIDIPADGAPDLPGALK